MTQLTIKWPLSFSSHPTSASALPGKTKQAKYYIFIQCIIIFINDQEQFWP